MELYNLNLELRALRSLADEETDASRRLALLGRLNVKHFSNDMTRSAYKRLQRLAKNDGSLPDWGAFVNDPRLTEDVREFLRESTDDVKTCRPARYKRLVEDLGVFSHRRGLNSIAKLISQRLQEEESDELDEASIHAEIAGALAGLGHNAVEDVKVYSMGKSGKSALKFVDKVIASPSERMLKTGFDEYDQVNGGFPTSGVVILAATTSGGKSAVSMNLGDNLALLNGISVNRITLEMTAEQEAKRYASMVSGVAFNKIKQAKLSKKEAAQIRESMMKHYKRLRKAGGTFGWAAPSRGMSMEDVLYFSASTGSHVSIIDYVGLLEGVDPNNQAISLSEAVRAAKIHATNTGRLYVILVQLDTESGKVRYSRAMVEHCDVLITWSYVDSEVRALHNLPIAVEKARDGELFEFDLPEDFATMSAGSRAVVNRTKRGGDRSSLSDGDASPFRSKKKSDDDEEPSKKKKPSDKPKSKFAKTGDKKWSGKKKESRGFKEIEIGSSIL